ncbi:hypothetical protein SteCoe_6104 [Stentor coeruleus]|uniref:Uncharacterized protein n=1 Tax=Stentor coeruleus TaxID=5963 RepID=A0A1R2CQY1_9CILI|nr:hypothetical protein SteCoe_6104 [Stentor coeruleus]
MNSLNKRSQSAGRLHPNAPPRMQIYEGSPKRKIYIPSRKSLKTSEKLLLDSSIGTKTKKVAFLSSYYTLALKNKGFELFTPNLYDLTLKNLDEEKKSIEKNILENNSKNIASLTSEDFFGKINKALLCAEIEKNDLQNISIKKPFNHSKAREFFKIVKDGNFSEVKYIIENYPDLRNVVDVTQQTGLHWACKRGDFKMVQLFLKNGFDWRATDMVDRTPYKIAEKGNYKEIMIELIRYKNMSRRGAREIKNLAQLKIRSRFQRNASRKATTNIPFE